MMRLVVSPDLPMWLAFGCGGGVFDSDTDLGRCWSGEAPSCLDPEGFAVDGDTGPAALSSWSVIAMHSVTWYYRANARTPARGGCMFGAEGRRLEIQAD